MKMILPPTTQATLRPLIDMFLNRLNTIKWAELEPECVNTKFEHVVTNCCLETVGKILRFEEFGKGQPKADPHFQSSPRNPECEEYQTHSEQERQVYLGERFPITSTEMVAILREISQWCPEMVTVFLMKTIMEGVNSELSKSFRGTGSCTASKRHNLLDSSFITNTLKTTLSFMVEMFQRCTARMRFFSNLNSDQSPNMEADTTVIPMVRDDPQRGSRVSTALIANIRIILEELMCDFSVIDYIDEITEDERKRLLSMILNDTRKAAPEIISLIRGRREPGTDVKTRLESKITALFVRRVFKELVLSLLGMLRRKMDCYPATEENPSVVALLDGVDCLVEDLLPPDEDLEMRGAVRGGLYRRIERKLSMEQLEVISKRLCDIILPHLKPDKAWQVHFRHWILTEVDTCMTLILDWLNRQAEQHEEKRGITCVALDRIERVVLNLPERPKSLWNRKTFKPKHAIPANLQESSPETEISDQQIPFTYDAAAQPDPFLVNLCHGLATLLIRKIFSCEMAALTIDNFSHIIVPLQNKLVAELEGSEIVVELTRHKTESIMRSVIKSLNHKTGSSTLLKVVLMAKKEEILSYSTELLKMKLVSPTKRRRFGISFKWISNPFTSCIKSRGKD